MTDQPLGDEALTPAQEERVRRLLADARHTAPMPAEVADRLDAVVRELAAEGMTLMMVTHEMKFARDVCSRVVFMHQGRVHEIGEPDAFFGNPQTPELRQFLGHH